MISHDSSRLLEVKRNTTIRYLSVAQLYKITPEAKLYIVEDSVRSRDAYAPANTDLFNAGSPVKPNKSGTTFPEQLDVPGEAEFWNIMTRQ
jgi:hypothetical protein